MRKTFITWILLSVLSVAVGDETKKSSVRYKSGKEINFEQLLIQGQIKRAEISVVTGSSSEGDDGLLRLRETFLDRIAQDIGEESK